MQVEKEVQELRERLAQVDEMKKRRDEIELELASVWTDKGDSLAAPAYIQIASGHGNEVEVENADKDEYDEEEFRDSREQLDSVAA